ncbi:MAG: DciA family protein [Hyphomicrobium sp.]|nr:DciA family protein [Hyphomicrobium sp.]
MPTFKSLDPRLGMGNRLPPDRRKGSKSYVRAAGSFVPRLTAKVFERYGFHSAEIMTSWAAVAGAEIAAVSAPERLRWPRGAAAASSEPGETAGSAATLILRVEPAHALDIDYRAGEIADRINRYFGYRAVAAIKILQAPLARTQNQCIQPTASMRPLPPPPSSLDRICDDGLKLALTALWQSVAAESTRL